MADRVPPQKKGNTMGKPHTQPESSYLTREEQGELRVLSKRIAGNMLRYAELMRGIKEPHGLDDWEKLELRDVIRDVKADQEKRKQLRAKDPTLPENLIENAP